MGQMGALSGRSAAVSQGKPLGVMHVCQVDACRGVQHERVGRVVGVDPLEEFAVLVGDRDVSLVGRGNRKMHLTRAARADRRTYALHGLSRFGIDEQHVPRRDERDDCVSLGRVDGDHVRPHGVRAGLRKAQARCLGREVDAFRRGRPLAPEVLEVIAVPDVQRAPERTAR